MTNLAKIIKYELHDVIRSKWLIIYTVFFLVITDGLFRFGGSSSKVVLSLINIVLIIIPLVSIIFGSMYSYNSREFVELLLAQPLNRKLLFTGMYAGLALPLSLGFVMGVGIPFAIHGFSDQSQLSHLAILLLSGVFLTCIFVGLAFLITVVSEDKAKGLGIAICTWLLFAVIYDGIVLFVVLMFGDYPLEKAMITLSLFNPIDLARILVLLNFDVSALMGYTGAVFQKFFGSILGQALSLVSLTTWAFLPVIFGLRSFARKDFS